MRIFRTLLAFMAGAVSMLVALIATGWAAPATLHRMQAIALPSAFSPAVAVVPAAPAPPTASAPAVQPAGDPSAAEVPFVRVAPADLPTAKMPVGAPAAAAAPTTVVPALQRLLIPVQGVKATSLVDTYQQARGQGRRHDAIDIVAPRGTPVLASSDGVVMKLFESVRGGTALYELAPDGRTIYYYAHLDRYAPGMAQGRALHRGEVLGFVGNTGDAGPGNYHLHFEVSTTTDPRKYWGGVPQNPYPLLR